MEILDIIRDPRILQVQKYGFRDRLYLEHIKEDGGIFKEVDLVLNDGTEIVERIMVFTTDITKPEYRTLCIPYQQYYPGGINNLRDKYLRELVEFYMHINPGIDDIGIKKMIEYLVRVKVKKINDVPTITFEQLEPIVRQLVEASRNKVLPKWRRLACLFSEKSNLTKEEKRQYAFHEKHREVRELKQELIHRAAVEAVDKTHRLVKITHPRVYSFLDNDVSPSVRAMTRDMNSSTKDFLKFVDTDRVFTSAKSMEKYYRFLALPSGTSWNDAANNLSTSKSTIQNYTAIKRKLND